MNKINLNYWYTNENVLSISLSRYYVKIVICKNNNFIFYKLEVFNNNKMELTCNFYSLEDAITFTEATIAKQLTIKEIIESYQEQFRQNKFKLLKKHN